MATRVPSGSSCLQNDFCLHYPGRKSYHEVLNGLAADLETVLCKPGAYTSTIVYGDNLRAMRALLHGEGFAGRVRLVYIDPPYASGGRYVSRDQQEAYVDNLRGASYLEFMRRRLILMRELLASDGSIYVHIDATMLFPLKLIMDEVFGPANFRNMITRRKCSRKNYTRNQYGNVADYILFYTKSDEYVWNQPHIPWDSAAAEREYPGIEEGTRRRFKKVPVHAPGTRNGATGEPWRGMNPPPGKHWQYTPDRLDEMDRRGEIYWSPTGNPRRKIYLDESPGIPVQDIWLEYMDAQNQMAMITGYPTEKNAEMIRRIVLASSGEGDLVADVFGGSGTVADVAEHEGRRWLTMDSSLLAIDTTIRRLCIGTQRMGDFVNGGDERPLTLLDEPGCRLASGLRLLADQEAGLERVEPEVVATWRRLLHID